MNLWERFITMAGGWSTLSVIVRLVLSVLIGAVIGFERGLKNHDAGIKTHVLVCVAAALASLISEYVLHQFPDAKADLNRLGAGVIGGVGFLGAGTIMVTGKSRVKGLTTAAGLWACACEGLAVGIGFVDGALYALIIIMLALCLFTYADNFLRKHSHRKELYLEFDANRSVKDFVETLHSLNIKFDNLQITKSSIKGEGPIVTVGVNLAEGGQRDKLMEYLETSEVIRYFEGL